MAEILGATEMTVARARRALVEEGQETALTRKPRPPKLDRTAAAVVASSSRP